MTYEITIGWYGWGCVVGEIPQETAEYIKKGCGGDGSTYAEKLDAGEVPENFRLAEYSDDFEVADSFFTMYGPNCESRVNVYGDGLPEDGLEIDATELTSETVDTHIKRLRDKIEQAGYDPSLVETVRGYGYRFKA